MSKDSHIEMSPDNFPGATDEQMDEMDGKILASEETEDGAIAIWYEPTPPRGEKIIFLNLGNTTINMPEQDLYRLTKLTQIAAKKLLNID